MKDIIKNLYWATIEDSDKKLMSKPLYIDGMKKSEKLHKQLERVMNKRQQHLFDRYYALMMELNTQER